MVKKLCDYCGESLDNIEAYTLDGNELCEECCNRYAERCPVCDEVHDGDEFLDLEEGGRACAHCIREHGLRIHPDYYIDD